MLESLEQSNIKRMGVENPEKERSEFDFDPEKELQPDFFEKIERQIDRRFQRGDYYETMQGEARLKMIDPDLMPRPISYYDIIAQQAERTTMKCWGVIQASYSAKMLDPEFDLERIKKYYPMLIEELRKSPQSVGHLSEVDLMKQVDPNFPYEISEEEVTIFLKKQDEYNRMKLEAPITHDLVAAIRLNLPIPEEYKKSFFQYLKERVAYYQKPNHPLVDMSENVLNISSALKTVSDIYKQRQDSSHHDQAQQLPEQKNF